MKKPGIVATLGYSYTNNSDLIEKLIQKGVNYFRFNLCKCEDIFLLKQRIEMIQGVSEKYNGAIKIMLDIPFPGKKPRIYLEDAEKIDIEKGELLIITAPNIEYKNDKYKKIVIDVECLGKKIDRTRPIVYSDGECTFDIVKSVDKDVIMVKANESQTIYNRKSLSVGYIEKRDVMDDELINIIKKVRVDSIALSFVTDCKEVKLFKSLFPEQDIISKIECPNGIKNVGELSYISDIMLGRGDLCLTADCYNLYNYQGKVAAACKSNGSKLYIATGILASLSKSCSPVQSDIIDVSNLILLSPDFLVLNFPVIYNNYLLAIKSIDNIFDRLV